MWPFHLFRSRAPQHPIATFGRGRHVVHAPLHLRPAVTATPVTATIARAWPEPLIHPASEQQASSSSQSSTCTTHAGATAATATTTVPQHTSVPTETAWSPKHTNITSPTLRGTVKRLAPHAAAVLPASNLRKSRASGTRATSNHACKILCQPFHCTYVTVLSRHPVRVAPNSMVPGQRSSFGVSVTLSSPRRCPCDAPRQRLRAAAAGAASAASAVSVAATTAQAPKIGGAGAKAPRHEQPRRTQRRQQWFPCLLQLGFD